MMRMLSAVALTAAVALAACGEPDPMEQLASDLVESGALGSSPSEGEDGSAEVAPQTDRDDAPPAPTAVDEGRTYRVDLVGDGQRGAADTEGTGTVEATVEADRLCYVVVASVSSPVTALHLHEGPPGEEGEVLASLEPPVDGKVDACTALDAGLAARIMADPSSFYLNLHTEQHPSGALRAQLG